MKTKMRRILVILMAVLVMTGAFTVCAFAEPGNDIRVLVTTETTSRYTHFDKSLGYPMIRDDRTLCPLRALGDSLDLQVDWDAPDRQAVFTKDESKTINGVDLRIVFEVRFTMDSSNLKQTYWIYTNGELYDSQSFDVPMDTKLVNKNDRVYAPARFLAESYGYDVGWDGPNRIVTINASDDWISYIMKEFGDIDV
ncbi:MAG: copper amine oxidase N-terminal domain-containing protein [Anaerovoracaceae bacterium]|nr:copper amine oxidase N-terminal domain-containing protein [Bacillota bacterium]MDY2670649.1 copper amine oxidase N-terminal domain-containing protein [Anaerovoracaceae bacterium]